MYIWPGIILQSYCTEKKTLKNGLFYKVIEITNEHDNIVTIVKLDKDMKETIDQMSIVKKDVPCKLVLSYAFTYYKAQGRTIKGSIRLAQTDHKYFTLRHLIVGLGRAPLGKDVHVA